MSTTASPKPLPSTVAGAAIELAGLRQVIGARRVAVPAYQPGPALLARVEALEAMLAEEPATAFEDLRARLAWMAREEREGVGITPATRIARLRRLTADIDGIERSAR